MYLVMDGPTNEKESGVVKEDILMSRGRPMSKPLLILTVLAIGTCAWAAAPMPGPAAPAAGFDLSQASARGPQGDGAPEWALIPDGPGWLHLPEMTVRLGSGALPDARVWVSAGPGNEWIDVHMAEGWGSLPLNVSTVSDLWALRFRVEGADASGLKLVPARPLVLTDLEAGNGVAPALTLTNWGASQALRVKAVDLSGRAVELQSADLNLTCSPQGEWYDLGVLPSGFERDIIVAAGQTVSYPVFVTVEDEAGVPAYAVMTGAPEAAPVGQVNYYGLTPLQQQNCTTGNLIANATAMVITAISAPVTYTVYNLTDGTTFATGTISAKGAQAIVNSMTDNRAWKLATSKPVQAYMGYDCSGTLPGTMFFLADDGMLNYGTDFTIPFANWEAATPYRLQYWVFATGAGTATLKTLGGTTLLTNAFTAAGGWQIPLGTLSRNTVYTIQFVPDVPGSGAQIAVQQSSQNAATDVPATTQVASACTVTNVGRTFFVNIQRWNNDGRIAVFPYEGTGSGTVTATPLPTGTPVTISSTLQAGTMALSGVLAAGSYQIVSTVNVGILAGSPEGGTGVWDLGDDAFYYHGDGTDVRGHAMRCGGAIFVAQDGTNIAGACTPGAPCGLPAITNPYNADAVLPITGNTANNNLFDFTTQDTQHTLLVETIGGNCGTLLNDWSKVLQPAALGRPIITYPQAGSPLLTTTPSVVGSAIPGATVTLYIAPPPPGTPGTQVLFGTATADGSGNWTIPYDTGAYAPLTPGTTYSFDAVQSILGACSTVAVPPIGSSGSSGVINVTPPTVVTPADGSTVPTLTPDLTGTAPAGTTVTLTITGPGGPYTVTTVADGAGNYSVPSPTLQPGGPYTVGASAQDGAGNTSAASATNTFNCVYPAPVVSSPINAGATSISGTSTAPAGTTITVYNDGVAMGTTTVQSGGAWTLTGVSGLVGGEAITATAGTGSGQSGVSNTVIVTAFITKTSSAGTGPVSPGDLLTYTISVTNFTASPWTGVAVSDPLPAGTTYVGGSSSVTYSTTQTGTYLDQFTLAPIANPGSYAGSDGTLNWAPNPWVEIGESDGPINGDVRVDNRYGTNSLRVNSMGGSLIGAYRPADLTGIAATLTFDYRRRDTTSGQNWYVDISKDYGATWPIRLWTLASGATDASFMASGSLAIPSDYLTANFVLRFVADGTSGSNTRCYFDNIQISRTTQTYTTVPGGAPPDLASGYALNPGDSLTVTLQATVDANPSASAIVNTATVTANGGAVSYASSVTNPLLPAPAVTAPVLITDTAITGTSTVIGGTVTVYQNGASIGTATVQGDGTWALTGVSGLAPGDSITATVTDGGATSPVSSPVLVTHPAPVVTGPIVADATSISGTSASPDGTIITVYKDGVSMGTATVTGGAWTLTGVTGLQGGETITAVAAAGTSGASAVSNAVVVTPEAPIVDGPLAAGQTAITGFCTAPVGSTVTVTVNGTPYTTTVEPGGTFTVTVPPLTGGETVEATVTAGGQTSASSGTQTVHFSAPVVTGPIAAGDASISGTLPNNPPVGTAVTVYQDGVSIGIAYTTNASGAWTLAGVSGLQGGEAITAVAAVGTAAESGVSNTVVVTPAPPVVTGPIVAGATSVGGTSTAPVGSDITVYVNGTPYTTTVGVGGTWVVTSIPAMAAGTTVNATVTAGGQTSAVSNTVTVQHPAPVVNGPILANPASITGTSSAPDGTTLTVYSNGIALGTTTVSGGSWTYSGAGLSGLIGGEAITATAGTGAAESAPSNTVVVTALPPSIPPIVSASLLAGGSQTILGSSVEAPGSVISVYVNGLSIGTTTVLADGSWSFGPTALAEGQVVSATVQASGKAVSALSNQVVVAAGAGSVTPPPVITGPIPALATSVSGTSLPNATVDVYADGVYLGTVTADGSGNWTLPGVPPLADGTILSATATVSGSGTSDWSAPVVVGTTLMLLRSDAMTILTQARAPIFTHPVATSPYPSLETIGPNHVFNQTEGSLPQPAAPGTADDDKAYVRNIHSGDLEPEPAVLTDNGRPLVFYELLDNDTKTLYLTKSGANIVFTITP